VRPAAVTCIGHEASTRIAPSAAWIRSTLCARQRLRLISAEIMGGARAHLRCQCQNLASTPDHNGRPRPPPASACCICLHRAPSRRTGSAAAAALSEPSLSLGPRASSPPIWTWFLPPFSFFSCRTCQPEESKRQARQTLYCYIYKPLARIPACRTRGRGGEKWWKARR